MVKVTLSAKIDDELKKELEIEAKEKKLTLSEYVAQVLHQRNEQQEKTDKAYELLEKQLDAKDKQIDKLQQAQLNEQELQLYKEKSNLIDEQKVLVEDTREESKKWWQVWR